MTTYFDSALLSRMIHEKRAGQPFRAVADAMQDISFSTVHRLERGSLPTIANLIEIANWLGVSPAVFFKSDQELADAPTGMAADMALLNDPRLQPETAKALANLVTLLVEQAPCQAPV